MYSKICSHGETWGQKDHRLDSGASRQLEFSAMPPSPSTHLHHASMHVMQHGRHCKLTIAGLGNVQMITAQLSLQDGQGISQGHFCILELPLITKNTAQLPKGPALGHPVPLLYGLLMYCLQIQLSYSSSILTTSCHFSLISLICLCPASLASDMPISWAGRKGYTRIWDIFLAYLDTHV